MSLAFTGWGHLYSLQAIPVIAVNSKRMSGSLKKRDKPKLVILAFGDGTPQKALITAALVGTLLVLINHGDAMLSGSFPSLTKVILTYLVPYCVTTWGAIIGKRAQWQKDRDPR